jgi:hypothetical protein
MSTRRASPRTWRAVVVGALAVGAMTAVVPSAAASPVGPCGNLRSFTVDFRTGGDDLRGNSEVIPFLTTTSGDVELQHIQGPFAGNSTNSRTVGLLNPNWTAWSCNGTGLKLRMVSHNDFLQTDDNWNMEGVTMYGYADGGQYAYYLSASNAFKRFTGSDQWWSRLG